MVQAINIQIAQGIIVGSLQIIFAVSFGQPIAEVMPNVIGIVLGAIIGFWWRTTYSEHAELLNERNMSEAQVVQNGLQMVQQTHTSHTTNTQN